MATDYSLACRTFALDLGKLAWSGEILSALGIDKHVMAPLAASGQALGTVTQDGAQQTGLPSHCVVSAGGHDHIVGAIAADSMHPGVLLNSTGTTEAALIGLDQPCRDANLAVPATHKVFRWWTSLFGMLLAVFSRLVGR